jgi:hypothetical protein
MHLTGALLAVGCCLNFSQFYGALIFCFFFIKKKERQSIGMQVLYSLASGNNN